MRNERYALLRVFLLGHVARTCARSDRYIVSYVSDGLTILSNFYSSRAPNYTGTLFLSLLSSLSVVAALE